MRKSTLKGILASSKDRLYIQRKADDTVRLTNGHWLICLPVHEFNTPEFHGYLPAANGEYCFTYGTQDSTGCPDTDKVFPADASILEELSETKDLKDTSRDGGKHSYARKFNGGDVTLFLNEKYVDMVKDAVSPDAWAAKDATSPAIATKDGAVVAIVMPMHV